MKAIFHPSSALSEQQKQKGIKAFDDRELHLRTQLEREIAELVALGDPAATPENQAKWLAGQSVGGTTAAAKRLDSLTDSWAAYAKMVRQARQQQSHPPRVLIGVVEEDAPARVALKSRHYEYRSQGVTSWGVDPTTMDGWLRELTLETEESLEALQLEIDFLKKLGSTLEGPTDLMGWARSQIRAFTAARG